MALLGVLLGATLAVPAHAAEGHRSDLVNRLSLPELDGEVRNTLLDYVRAGGTWTGSENQTATKTAGLVHLLTGSGDYQFV